MLSFDPQTSNVEMSFLKVPIDDACDTSSLYHYCVPILGVFGSL